MTEIFDEQELDLEASSEASVVSEEARELAIKRELVLRTYEAELSPEGDGRTLELRVVPYNKIARVSDPPDFMPYDEVWMAGAFQRQLSAANRVDVFLNYEHEQGLRGVIGHGVSLTENSDGLYGTFRVHDNADGNKALQLVNDGLLRGVSLEAKPVRSVVRNGLVARMRAHLDAVALCRTRYPGSPIKPAYADAQVLAVRQTPAGASPEPPSMDPDLVERLALLGVSPMLTRAVVRKPWDGSASRFTDAEYQASCLIDRGGDAPVKERCSLPVLEPNGDLNVNALGAAAGRLYQVTGASREMKTAAARKLIRYYRQADMPPPATITQLAQS